MKLKLNVINSYTFYSCFIGAQDDFDSLTHYGIKIHPGLFFEPEPEPESEEDFEFIDD